LSTVSYLQGFKIFSSCSQRYIPRKKRQAQASGFLKISSFLSESVNFGKGLPYFFFSYSGRLQDEKRMNYSKEGK
jgi:hypothetical protein